MLENVVFSSQEFDGTSNLTGFPIVVALYKRTPNTGLTYGKVLDIKFQTTEGKVFSVNSFDYVTDYVEKYPTNLRYKPEILFYTLRDINALRRSRTFIKDRVANAVDVNPKKLAYYCYIDCFKDRLSDVPFYLGNFNIPFDKNNFDKVARDFMFLSAHKHPEIFKKEDKPKSDIIMRTNKYIDEVLGIKKEITI